MNFLHRVLLKAPSASCSHKLLLRTSARASSKSSQNDPPPARESQSDSASSSTSSSNIDAFLVGRDFLSLKHFGKDEIHQFLWTAKDLKTRIKDNGEVLQPLTGKTAALVFEKDDTASRLNAELGLARLGGQAAYFNASDLHLDGKENWKDSARLLAGAADLIIVGAGKQEVLEEVANESTVPVVTGMSDLLQPLQVLAYFVTLQEYFGYLRGLKIAWIGDGNSVLNSLLYGCARLGIDLNTATPVGYEPDTDVMLDAMKISGQTGASFLIGNDPLQAVYRADAIIADSWTKPGADDENIKKRIKDFAGFGVNRKMMKEAGGEWVFLHSLPRRPHEVTDDIYYGQESLVWRAAENRLWITMAVMLHLFQPYSPTTPKPKYVRG
ncbi:ornithine carbamoyltransferase, mitochondrial isoform X2 [Aplysia californica]|uniref:ornithine carbamoyltransferase n=1 Tax=Aplysia californica TaxID=6500 RepID=A0ABM0K402_APLCA|nr:ornithine carbamoyltransferase, mitochondrial isoform X2 [Aplysia californica]